MLQEEEVVKVMTECLKENGLKLPQSDVNKLASALYDEALGEEEDTGNTFFD